MDIEFVLVKNLLSTSPIVFVSILALGFTIWQAKQTIKHQKLSVRPLLMIHYEIDSAAGREKANIYLENSGIGPAIIRQYQLFFDDELQPVDNNGGLMKVAFMIEKSTTYAGGKFFNDGDAISEKKEDLIFRLEAPIIDNERILDGFKRIRVRVEYESLYQEKSILDTVVASQL